MAYVLKLTNYRLSILTVKEYVNMWHAYVWTRRQHENTLAGLVTIWVANSARARGQKQITLEDIFTDGRFDKFLTDRDMKLFKELYGQEGVE